MNRCNYACTKFQGSAPALLAALLFSFTSLAAVLDNGSKPDYCRQDLPGCCPKLVKHVFFLHIEKTGGTHARSIVKEAVAAKLDGAYACNYLDKAAYDCLPTTKENQVPWCNRKNMAYYHDYIMTGKHFAGRCALTAGHHDFKMFELFPEHLKPHTLIITNFREPISRLVSHYHMLRRFNYTPAFDFNITQLFVGQPKGMARTRNKMTRMVSGDFCCANGTAIKYDDNGLLDRAMRNMQRTCVVGLTERLSETLQYLFFVLGLPYPHARDRGEGIREYNRLDRSSLELLKQQNTLDMQLFQAAVMRFDQQMEVMSARAREPG